MTRYRKRIKGLVRTVRLGLTALLVLFSAAALADDSSGYTVVDGVLLYYSVIPAEMIRAYPRGSAESRMHGGVPDGAHIHHIQIALFDANTNERITDARVTAAVSEPGFPAAMVELEPFAVQGTITYGNYHKFSNLVTYRIDIKVEHPSLGKIVRERFEYRHH